jgi:hypothetical protein
VRDGALSLPLWPAPLGVRPVPAPARVRAIEEKELGRESDLSDLLTCTATDAALRVDPPLAERVDVSRSDDAYDRLLRELWAAGEDSVIVEHDVVIGEVTIESVEAPPVKLAKTQRTKAASATGRPRVGRLYPLPVRGSVARGRREGCFWTPLVDGTRGFLQRRSDDCFTSASASLLQVAPYEGLPD